MRPDWLSIAGDIGSSLGGLALLTAGIGYILRTRASAAEDRRLLAQRIDGLTASLAEISRAVDQWVADESISASTIRQLFDKAVGSPMGLETEARGPRMRRVAEELEAILSAFAIHVSAFGAQMEERADLQREFNQITRYLLSTRHILLATREDPVRALRGLVVRRSPNMGEVLEAHGMSEPDQGNWPRHPDQGSHPSS
jgi:hypothetical protein